MPDSTQFEEPLLHNTCDACLLGFTAFSWRNTWDWCLGFISLLFGVSIHFTVDRGYHGLQDTASLWPQVSFTSLLIVAIMACRTQLQAKTLIQETAKGCGHNHYGEPA